MADTPQTPPHSPEAPPSSASSSSAPSAGSGSHNSQAQQGPRGPRHAGPRTGRPPRKPRRQYVRKRKVCRFCVEKMDHIDYKNVELLQTFILDRGKVVPRRITGTCSRHQRWLKVAIKRARNIALLPFSASI